MSIPERDTGGNLTGKIPVRILLTGDSAKGTRSEVLNGLSGKTYRLANRARLSPVAGPDGAMAVVTDHDGIPHVMVPNHGIAPRSGASVRQLSAIPHWTVEIRVEDTRYLLLFYIACGVLFLGLMLVLVSGDCVVTLCAVDEDNVWVVVSSPNRPSLVQKVLSSLEESEGAA